jgi:1-deoxy-D-xylulose-5-phosphate reductoisomerase
MSSISGLDGLDPTIKMIKYTKIIAIANKEAIICGSNLINKELAKNNTKFIPVDSEHYSIYYALQNYVTDDVENIYLTASGGPLKNLSLKKFKYVKISDALKHPNWSMGKKISIDSATMMNKVFEIIEAHKIFKVPYSKLKILIHPKSYIHAIVKFKDGMIKIIAHDTNMRIPIFNTLNFMLKEKLKTEKINIKNLNNLNLSKVNYYKFPLVKIIEKLSIKDSLFETIIVSANDELVNLFLQKKIKFTQISEFLLKFIKLKEFNKYKHIKPKNIKDIIKLSNYVRFKIKNLSI